MEMLQADATSGSPRRGLRILMKSRSLSRAHHINKEYDGPFSNEYSEDDDSFSIEDSEDDDYEGYVLPHEHEFHSVRNGLMKLALDGLRGWISAYDHPVPECHDWDTTWKKGNKGLKRCTCDGNPSITSAQEADKPSGKQKPISASTSHGPRRPHKRCRRESTGDDNEPPDRRMLERERSAGGSSSLKFACPFYAHDPIQFRSCRSLSLTTVSNVKQHLKRRHKQPTHCKICLERIPDNGALDDHIRAQKRNYEAPDGMTPLQEIKVASRFGARIKLASDQWFAMYEILFPRAIRPKSAYLDDAVPEEVESLRRFIEQRGTAMIVGQLQIDTFQPRGEVQGLEERVQNALSNVLNEWKNRHGSAKYQENHERGSGLETASQQGVTEKGAIAQPNGSGSVEGVASVVQDEKLGIDNEVVNDEDTSDEQA